MNDLVIKINGAVESTNILTFKADVMAMVEKSDFPLVSDQDFADAEKTVKNFKQLEDAIKAAREKALSDTADIANLFSELDEISNVLRTVRLSRDKEVKKEKASRKAKIVDARFNALEDVISKSGLPYGVFMAERQSFVSAIKGKKKLEAMEDALDKLLKFELGSLSDVVESARKANEIIDKACVDYAGLFPDRQSLITKDVENLTVIIEGRIAKFELAEKEKAELEEKRKAAKELADKEKADQEAREKAEHFRLAELAAATKKEHESARPVLVVEEQPEPSPQPLETIAFETREYKVILTLNCGIDDAKKIAGEVRQAFTDTEQYVAVSLTSN